MKKSLLIAAAVAMAVMLTAPAMAADLTATGFIGVTGTVYKNVSMPLAGYYVPITTPQVFNKMGANMAMRARLGFNVRASEDLYGAFMFELDGDKFGEWGATGNRNVIDTALADRNAIEIKSVYIDFRVPPKLPIWLRLGVQPYNIRPTLFSSFDAAGVSGRSVIDALGKLSISAYYAKILDTATPDGSTNGGGDRSFWEAVTGSEFYAVDMNVPFTIGTLGNIKPGAFFAYQDIRMDGSNNGIGGNTGWTAASDKFSAGVDDAYIYWLGAYLDGKIGPLPMGLDFIYQGGKVTYTAATNQHTTLGSFLVRGWLSYIFKGLEVGAGGMYVQGEDYEGYYGDPAAVGRSSRFLPNGGARSSRFLLPQPGSDSSGMLGDTVIFTGGWMGTGINAHNPALMGPNLEYPGFWYARGYAYYKVFNWLKVGAQLAYIGDTDRHENNRGFSIYYSALRDANENDGIGWEMDYGVNVQLYKNLSFNGAFGYLFAQKALSMAGGMSPSDPWTFVGLLLYTF